MGKKVSKSIEVPVVVPVAAIHVAQGAAVTRAVPHPILSRREQRRRRRDRKSTRLNSSHIQKSRMPSSA